ncbi:MAG TPA: hypothetical protein VI039_06245 [Solirubrobacterales bacterium]
MAVPGGASAHHSPGEAASLGEAAGGRLAGQPDFTRIGKATMEYQPGTGEYMYRELGKPMARTHGDSKAEIVAGGAYIELPGGETAPTCSVDGQRVVVVFTHRPGDPTPTPVATLRSIVNRMNYKLRSESLASSFNARALQLVVSCNSSSEVQIFDVATASNDIGVVDSTLKSVLGDPKDHNAVKYLAFDTQSHPSASGIALKYSDAKKSGENFNAVYTATALVYGGSWSTHVTLHELFHTFGATQYPAGNPPPFASPFGHCTDGNDLLCYADGPGVIYSETRCPAAEGYEQPAKLPLDCGYDTYFDSLTEPGEWLSQYWNSGGPENPFVREVTTPPGDGHPVSMRDPVTNQFWIYYRGSNSYIWELYRDPKTGNWFNNKVPATQAAAVGTSPVIGRNATTNAQWIYYQGADDYIWELYRNPSTGLWSNTKIPNAKAAAVGSSPVMMGDPSAGAAWIYYRATDSYIWELYRDPITGNWFNTKVPAGHSAAVETSPVIGRNATTNAQWIYYRGSNGYIWELYRDPKTGNWFNTKVPNSQPAGVGSSPAIMGDPSIGAAWMYYRAADGYIWELYRNPSTGLWANNKVPAVQPAAGETTPVIGRNATTNAQWIYYQGADGYIWELYRNPSTGLWSNTKIPNAQAASPGSSPTMLGDPSTGEAWIEYRGSDGYIWELWRNPSTGVWANGKFPTAQM